MSTACSVACGTSSADEPLDRFGMCRQCARAYELGRTEALEEVLAAALRVRGAPARVSRVDVQDEHADGSYGAAQAIVAVIRRFMRRRVSRRRMRR